jgi:hypothetical protein
MKIFTPNKSGLFAEITEWIFFFLEIFEQFLYQSKALNEINPKSVFLTQYDDSAF